ncbi:MAG: hypothetical protein M5R40_06390 [Anaerolineae bacterium]|nr:hypothetical protein [Anaerolineae bacterium]
MVAGILTDFRGTDTLIEITVFGVATLGVLTMLARPRPTTVMPIFRRRATQGERAALKAALEEDAERPDSLVYRSQFVDSITRLAAALVMPIALLIALAHILYGGVSPGDGFTAGVISGLAIALWYVVFGYEEARRRLGWLRPAPLVGVGLVIAIGNAMLPLAFGREFLALTQVTGISFANFKFASSLVFELGIFLTVLGGVSAILEAINHPKEVESL